MAYPVVEDFLTQLFTSATNTHDVTMPTTVNSGELLIIIFSCDGVTFTDPTGWTKLVEASADTRFVKSAVYVKVADGTEGGTSVNVQTTGSSRAAVNVYRISGFEDGLSGLEETHTTGSSTSPNPPSISPSWGASNDTLFIAWETNGPGADSITAFPSGYTNTSTVKTGLSTFDHYGIASCRKEANTASEDAGAFTLSASDYWTAGTLAIKGTAGGGAGTNMQLNIGDSWKTIDGMQINIGDVWKEVAGAQVNIGDSWKNIF